MNEPVLVGCGRSSYLGPAEISSFVYSLGARGGFTQSIFYKNFDRFSL